MWTRAKCFECQQVHMGGVCVLLGEAVTPSHEGSGSPCVDPTGSGVGGHEYTSLSEDTWKSPV